MVQLLGYETAGVPALQQLNTQLCAEQCTPSFLHCHGNGRHNGQEKKCVRNLVLHVTLRKVMHLFRICICLITYEAKTQPEWVGVPGTGKVCLAENVSFINSHYKFCNGIQRAVSPIALTQADRSGKVRR